MNFATSYNISFVNDEGRMDETQLDAESLVDLVNVILSVKDEMKMKEVLYINVS